MIAYVTVGADDIQLAEQFYSSFLLALGYKLERYHGDLSYIPPSHPDQTCVSPDFYVKRPFDGAPASPGNGVMVAFQASNQREVRKLHAAAVASGGTDEGQPGFRDTYGADFFVGYLRDPHGNKIALFSSNPHDPKRDGT